MVDLGCGTGQLTASLAETFPRGSITGVDTSPDMLAVASRHAGPRVAFAQADLARWVPSAPVDVVVSNAAFHWVRDHEALLSHIIGYVARSATIAFQMPANFGSPSHTILAELARRYAPQATLGQSPLAPTWYVETLSSHGFAVDAWETTYHHVLSGDDAVFEWVSGTALRPVLEATAPAQCEFLSQEYRKRLQIAYPASAAGTHFPFRRLFVVAHRV